MLPGAARCSVMTGVPWEKGFARKIIKEIIKSTKMLREESKDREAVSNC